MSGAKTISVDQGAWNQAQRSARELATVRREMPRMLENVRRQTQADIDRAVSAVNQRQERVEHQLSNLSHYTRDMEARTNAKLREQATQLRKVRDEARREARRLDREIKRERAERKRQVAELDNRINDINARRDRASQLAMAFYEDARVMALAIRELPHERFAPGRLAQLEGRLTATAGTMHQVDAAYSVSGVQELYYALSDLGLEVRQAEHEWRMAQLDALNALRQAAERVEQFAVTPLLDEDGNEMPDHMLDVDFWTDGCLNTLRDDVRRETETVADDDCPLTVEELREVIQQHALGYENRLNDVLERGAARMYASQIRFNTAEKVIDALEVEGYEFVEDTYEGSDYREAHYTKLRHMAGEGEIVVEITPEGDTGMAIKLLSYDRDPAESRRAERTDNLLVSLRADGIPVGQPTDRGTEPTPEEGDFAVIRERRRRVG
jgi:DNA repair exonuclease SbcCD ATPase subunit